MGAGISTNGQSSPEIVKLQTEFAEANTKIDSIYKNNSNLATSLDLNTAVLPLAKTADMTNLVQKSDITALTSSFNINNLVQKSDLADVAQKTDLADIAQKCNLTDVAQKTDLVDLMREIQNIQNSIKDNKQPVIDINSIASVVTNKMIGLDPYTYNSITCPLNWTKVDAKKIIRTDPDKKYNIDLITTYDGACIISPTTAYSVYSAGSEPKQPIQYMSVLDPKTGMIINVPKSSNTVQSVDIISSMQETLQKSIESGTTPKTGDSGNTTTTLKVDSGTITTPKVDSGNTTTTLKVDSGTITTRKQNFNNVQSVEMSDGNAYMNQYDPKTGTALISNNDASFSSPISQAVSVSPISQAFNGLPVVAYDNQSNIYFPKPNGSNMTTSYICPPNSSLYSYNDIPVCVLTFEDHIQQVCPTGKVTKNLKGISGNVTINSTKDRIWCDNDV